MPPKAAAVAAVGSDAKLDVIMTKLEKLDTLETSLGTTNQLLQDHLARVNNSLFHSHLIYCLPIWSCTSQANINKIKILQKSAIRILDNSNYNSHTEPLFKKHKILPLENLITFFNLQFIHFFKTKKLPNSFLNMWETNQNDLPVPVVEVMQLRPRGYFKHKHTRLSTNDKFPLFY